MLVEVSFNGHTWTRVAYQDDVPVVRLLASGRYVDKQGRQYRKAA